MNPIKAAPTVAFDPGSQEFARSAYQHYAELRDRSPVHRLVQPDGVEIWLVTRYEDVRAALADPRVSKDPRRITRARISTSGRSTSGVPNLFHQPFIPDMLSVDGSEHSKLRGHVNRAFAPRRIESLRSEIEDLTGALLDEMAGREDVDLLGDFAYPLAIAVIGDLLGVPSTDREPIRRYADYMVASEGPEQELNHEPGKETFARFTEYLSNLIHATARRVAGDLPEDQQPGVLHSLLITPADRDPLTHTEIVDMLRLLLLAGHETTANLIGNGMLALLRNPAQLAVILDQPDLLPNAVEELLRYDGPLERATWRYTLEPVRAGGVIIPANRAVGLVIAAANHDPGHFPDPERLDVTRACPQHLGFGYGIHFCLGAWLARMEAQIALGRVLERFPKIELACAAEDLRFRASGYLVRSLRTLPVRLHAGSGPR